MSLKSLREVAQIGKFKIGFVDPKELKLLEKNARYMPAEMFDRLVQNIKKDKQLSSVPFCYLDPETGEMTVLSGNHRVKAALAAGLEVIPVMWNVEPMTEDERLAIQLSHNAIQGMDDLQILKELYSKIQDVELKEYAAVDIAYDLLDLEEEEEVNTDLISTPDLPDRTIVLVFTEPEFQRIREILEKYEGDTVLLAHEDQYEKFNQIVAKLREEYDVFNTATVFRILIEGFEKFMKKEAELDDLYRGDVDVEGMVNWRVGGTKGVVDVRTARKLKKLIDRYGLDEIVRILEEYEARSVIDENLDRPVFPDLEEFS